MSVTTSRMHMHQLNHKILQVKVNTMRSSDILSQRPQHLCTGVYTAKLMSPVHSKVEVRFYAFGQLQQSIIMSHFQNLAIFRHTDYTCDRTNH